MSTSEVPNSNPDDEQIVNDSSHPHRSGGGDDVVSSPTRDSEGALEEPGEAPSTAMHHPITDSAQGKEEPFYDSASSFKNTSDEASMSPSQLLLLAGRESEGVETAQLSAGQSPPHVDSNAINEKARTIENSSSQDNAYGSEPAMSTVQTNDSGTASRVVARDTARQMEGHDQYSMNPEGSGRAASIRSSRHSLMGSDLDRSTGILLMRPGAAPRQSSAADQEERQSLDGYLDQTNLEDIPSGATIPYSPIQRNKPSVDKAPWDTRSNGHVHCICTLLSVSSLVAITIFFASQIGPFYVRPALATSSSSTTPDSLVAIMEPSSTTSASAAAESYFSNFPSDMDRAFLSWRVPFRENARELPVLWTLENSGGDVVQQVFGECLGKFQAGHGMEFDRDARASSAWTAKDLRVVYLQGQKFVNVDLFSTAGIQRAARLGLGSSDLVHVAYTSLLGPITSIFEESSHGRLFIVFRDPIQRALNRFEKAKLETGNQALTLSQFAKTENNPLTRALLELPPDAPLSLSLLETAKEVINRKVLVGLLEHIDETLTRYEKFLSWYASDAVPAVKTCHKTVQAAWEPIFAVQMDYTAADPLGLENLVAQHKMDILLYQHAIAVYEAQGQMLFSAVGA